MEQGTLILMLNNAQLKGTAPVEINNSISKQVLTLKGYRFKSSHHENADYLNFNIPVISSASHLIDSTNSSSFLALPLDVSATHTFVSNCTIPYYMDKELPKSFYVDSNLRKQSDGTVVAFESDALLTLIFSYSEL